MAGKTKLSKEDREEIIRCNEEGQSYAELAQKYGVHYNTINRICNPDKYELQKERNIESNKKNRKSMLKTRKENQQVFSLILSKTPDGDMIEHLESKDNVNFYLKSLVRSDMEVSGIGARDVENND